MKWLLQTRETRVFKQTALGIVPCLSSALPTRTCSFALKTILTKATLGVEADRRQYVSGTVLITMFVFDIS